MSNRADNKRKQASRDHMFRALFELIQTRKIQDISISVLCQLAGINRTTFYSHYNNITELASDARESILHEYVHQFDGNTDGFTPENLLIMFQHLYQNQIIYRIYFQLNPSYRELLPLYDKQLAKRHYPGQDDKLLQYHAEFFAAGITAIIRHWLDHGCPETPAEMVKIILSEYRGRG